MNPTLLEKLKNPFDPKFIKWRVGATNKDKTKGIALAYLDAREVTKRLDDVLGADKWQDKLIREADGFVCELSIEIDKQWITRSDAAGLTKVEPVKGGASDAFKRAAAKWGIGRYLYYLPNEWVAIVPNGNSYKLAQTPTMPKWALPNSDWEKQAENEATAANTQGADEHNVDDPVEATLQAFKEAETKEQIDSIISALPPSQQRVFAPVAENRMKELNNGTKN
jgi:hypothetical protein